MRWVARLASSGSHEQPSCQWASQLRESFGAARRTRRARRWRRGTAGQTPRVGARVGSKATGFRRTSMKNTPHVGWILFPALLVLGLRASRRPLTSRRNRRQLVQRDFTKELANKIRGTYVVAATGDVLMQEALGRQASPALQRLLQEANTTIGHARVLPAGSPCCARVAGTARCRAGSCRGSVRSGGVAATRRMAMPRSAQASRRLHGFRIPVAPPGSPARCFRHLPAGRAALINAGRIPFD